MPVSEVKTMRGAWTETTSNALTRIKQQTTKFGSGLIGFLKACLGFLVQQVWANFNGGGHPFNPLGFKLTVVVGFIIYAFYSLYCMMYPDAETLKFFIRLFFAADSIRLFSIMFDKLDYPFQRELGMVIFRLAVLSLLGVPVVETLFGAFVYQKFFLGDQSGGQNANQVLSDSDEAEQPEEPEEAESPEPTSTGDSRQI